MQFHCLQSGANMRNIRLRHIFLAFADLLSTLPISVRSQSACLSPRPPIQHVVYEQAVSINTDVLYNTTFYPLPEAAITVTNAPTRYSGVTTLQWTSTILEDDTSPSYYSVKCTVTQPNSGGRYLRSCRNESPSNRETPVRELFRQQRGHHHE